MARARLAARARRSLVTVTVVMADDIEAHRLRAVAVVANAEPVRATGACRLRVQLLRAAAATQLLFKARVGLSARREQHTQARPQRRCRVAEAHASHLVRVSALRGWRRAAAKAKAEAKVKEERVAEAEAEAEA